MRKLAFAGFVAFWASAITLIAVGLLSPAPSQRPAQQQEEEPVYTREEVAQHNTPDDCWMAIRGKVYDFTEYIPEHPTTPDIMTDWCGKEATEAYETKTYGAPHSEAADEMMEQYRIGILAPAEQ